MTTINDIAKQAGVAKSTVSRYLNGGSISKKTAQKIETVIKAYDYVPSTFAQSLKAKNSRLIGIILPRLDSRAAIDTLQGIDQQAQIYDYQVLIANAQQTLAEEIRHIHAFAREKVAGIIVMTAKITTEHIQAVQAVGLPTIFVGQEHADMHCVVHDDYQAGYNFAQELLALGHRKITYFNVTKDDYAVGFLRKQGVLDGFKQCPESSVTVEKTTFQMIDALEKGMDLLPSNDSTLWLAATDNIAVGLLKAAHAHQLTLPQELSIAGFGGYDISDYVYPALSTVHFRYVEAGEQSLKHLHQLIQGQEVPLKTIVGFEIYHRDSVQDLLSNN